MNGPNWEYLRTFLAAMTAGSLAGAARLLGVSQPTVGRQLDALEAELGVRLFIRSREGLSATSDATRLMPLVQNMSSAALEIDRSVQRPETEAWEGESGTIRIATSEVMGTAVLPRMLERLSVRAPRLQVELVLSNRAENLLKRDADIAIRMFQPSQQALIARKVGVTPIGLYAHRRYLDRCGEVKSLNDLQNHTFVGPDRDQQIIAVIERAGVELPPFGFHYRTDNQVAQMELVLAGVGVGGMQSRLAAQHPELVPILPRKIAFPMEIWMVMHEDLRHTPRVRMVYDFFFEELSGFVKG